MNKRDIDGESELFELKHVRAELRDPKRQQSLLEDGQISLEKFKNFDQRLLTYLGGKTV